jgi:hypothetical protein
MAVLFLGACAGDVDGVGTLPSPADSSSASTPAAVPSGRLASSLVALFQQVFDDGGKDSLDGLSPMETEVLLRSVEAGSISVADYEMTHAAFMTCMSQRGVDEPWKKGADGVYHPQGYDSSKVLFTDSELSAARDACEPLVDAVQWLYTVQQSNPDLFSDQDEQVVACLRRNGVVDDLYTPEQLQQDTIDRSLPFDVFDPVPNACLAGAGYLYLRVE